MHGRPFCGLPGEPERRHGIADRNPLTDYLRRDHASRSKDERPHTLDPFISGLPWRDHIGVLSSAQFAERRAAGRSV